MDYDEELLHIGVARRSGRYPWGSGGNAEQHGRSLQGYVAEMRKKGIKDTDIAKSLDLTTTAFRAEQTIAKNAVKAADLAFATRLKEKGMSNQAIAERLGLPNESSVRSLLNPATIDRNLILNNTVSALKDQFKTKEYLDVGEGNEVWLGISDTKLKAALAVLKEEGYRVDKIKVPQLGTKNETVVKVLSPPGTEYKDIATNPGKIASIAGTFSEDGGRSFRGVVPPANLSSKRIAIRYGDEGGSEMDGVIQIRRGVEDISLGLSRYAQVRVAVDGTHYLKGMAMYADDLPDGVDVRFNTNKDRTDNKLDAMKPMKGEDNPFGSTVRQRWYEGADGKKHLSVLNIVGTEDPDGNKTPGEEGGWYQWSRSLSSQALSKQAPLLAKEQLGLAFQTKKENYEEIMALTNPAVRKALLEKFADEADSAAVHLKAAGLPGTRNHVILPINSLKPTEVYAPQYRDGDRVVLIRHPHGGKFEIPELTVNNRNREANRLIPNAKDAIGINSKVAQQLSGADFDGDTVLVIPNNGSRIKTESPLAKLKGFEPQRAYPAYEGMPKMKEKTKQQQMGSISNLITDMTIRGATNDEIARAVRHSMVVIDAEKHNLNYKQSAIDNGIKELQAKYQVQDSGRLGGAATLVSRASSEVRIAERKPRPAKDGGPVDPVTGRKVYVETGNSYVKVDNKGRETVVVKSQKSSKMAETDDARTLVSSNGGTPIERVYADHANRLKALANQARKDVITTKKTEYSPTANKVYQEEAASLKAKLNTALKNKPLERQAQLLGNAHLKTTRDANPNMSGDEVKKVKSQALAEMRVRTGARKQQVVISPKEWEAIQAGAISDSMLRRILQNADIDTVRQLATPRERTVMSDGKIAQAKAMLARGYTQAEIADALGVPTSTLNDSIS